VADDDQVTSLARRRPSGKSGQMLIELVHLPSGSSGGRLHALCPGCGRACRVLLPTAGSGLVPVVIGELEAANNEADLPNLIAGLSWACRRCLGVGSEASRLSRAARDARALDRRAADGRVRQRRPGESWAQEKRRQARMEAAAHRMEQRFARRLRLET
jgi:hypothetical protein